MRRATRCLALPLALSAALPLTAAARPAWMSGTYVYADLCTEPGDGRMEGRRITVRRSPNGDGVTYEAAAGPGTMARPAEAISIDDDTRQIAFTVEGEAGLRFQGVAATDVLAGTISDAAGEHPLRLRRVLRSHEREACRSMQQDPDTTASAN